MLNIRIMKLRNLLIGAVTAVFALAGCDEFNNVDLGKPTISIDKKELRFDAAGGDKELVLNATFNWEVKTDVDWVVVTPESGSASAEAQTITVSVLENTGMDRETDIKFTIGMKNAYLTVYQEGPGGSVEALIVYANDYDKVEATKEYGSSGESWPYLDQFDGWMNATGTGAANVEYEYKGMSTRANSTSNSSYSDYDGSGKNNMFFGASAYLATKNISLGGATDFTLTFGTEKYSQDNGSVFTNSEFHIYLSNDGAKWVELTDYTFAGGTTEGRWNIAKADFSVPEGTENLSICMQVDVASSYRMDDFKLVISEGGETVDFSKAAEVDFTKPSGGSQGGSESDATAIYNNNYDKEAATKTYGSSGESWPYLDQFDGWMNAAGTGAAGVTYKFNGISARNNSTSNGSYSDYKGSGLNNIFFGSNAYFSTNDIALNGATGLTLTFGTEKYSQDNGSLFKNSEYHLWLSADGKMWVELTDYTFAGGTTEGRWNVATANFTVPAGTEKLSVCMQVDVASSYRLDDFKLVASDGGVAVDFSKGVEKDFTAGGTSGGGSTTIPESKGKKTVTEFIAAADNANYYELTGTVSGFNPTYCSFDLTDATGKIYVYSVLDGSKSEWTSKISNGGTITIYGKYLYYDQKSQHEVVDAYIVSFTGGSGSVDSGKPESLVKATIAEFLKAEEDDTWYELTGEIISIVNEDYGNFTIKDATGDVYIYGMTNGWVGYNNKSFSQIGLKVGDTVTLGSLRGSYNGDPQGGGNSTPAYYISHVPGEGGEVVTPPSGEAGEFDPQGVTWTLGEKAYDNTSSGSNAQTGTVNGVSVKNMLKLGTGSLVGDATLHVAAGTKKLGFYCVAWKGKSATNVKFSVNGTEITTIKPAANTGATGNPPYKAINVSASDYYEVELPSGATDIKVETLDPANGRVLFIGLKAIAE